MPAQDPIEAALRPLLAHPERWTLHFPMYVNTFCLAYHLATYLQKRMSPQEVDANFVADDWWRGRPAFTYRTDIEIFVAVGSTIDALIQQGHTNLFKYQFTNYCQKFLFTRKGRSIQSGTVPFVITDVPQTADILREKWAASPPPWLQGSTVQNPLDLEVRRSWTRGIGDLFDTRPKIYAFSAPLTQILFARSFGASAKYEILDAQTQAIPTYYVLRCNSGVSNATANSILNAIRSYYQLILDDALNRTLIDDKLANAYARLALSGGAPNPFPEIYPGNTTYPPLATPRELAERYADILDRHHEPSPGVP